MGILNDTTTSATSSPQLARYRFSSSARSNSLNSITKKKTGENVSAASFWKRTLLGLRLKLSCQKNDGAVLDSTLSSMMSCAIPQEEFVVAELPAVLWTTFIFAFLDRAGQDALAQAHPDVAVMRRSVSNNIPIDWPSGSLTKFSRPVKKVAFSTQEQNQQLCVVYCKSKVIIYDKLCGPQQILKGHTGIVADVKFSPTDPTVLATAGKSDGTIRLWKRGTDTETSSAYSCFRILQVHQHDLRHMLWSPTGTHICSWGQDGFVRISNIQDGSLKSRHWTTRFEVSGCHETVAFSHATSLIAYARNNERVVLWNWNTDEVQLLPDLQDEHGTYAGEYITSVAYSPDGMTLAVGCHVATIKLWRLVPKQHDNADNSVNNNTNDAMAGGLDMNHDSTHHATAHTTTEYEHVFSKQLHLGDGWSAVTLLTFTRDGRYLACSNHGSQIRIVDTTTDQIVATFNKGGHSSRIESLCFTPDGRTLASGACDRTVRLWDTSRLCSCSYVNH